MLRIEVDERHWAPFALGLPPDLAKYTNVWSAHKHLPQYIKAVRSVNTHNVRAIDKCALLFRYVVIIIPMQTFAKKIL